MAVYSKIVAFCNELAPEWRKSRRENLIRSMVALIVRRSRKLSHLAQHIPAPTQPKARRVKQWLWHRL